MATHGPKNFSDSVGNAWTVIGWTVMLLCAGLPIGWLLWQVVANPSALSSFRLDAFRWGMLGRTVGYNVAAAGIAVLLGTPAAMVIGRGRGWLARVVMLLLPVSLLLPSIVYAYGWAQFVRLVSEPAGRFLAGTCGADCSMLKWLGITLTPGYHGVPMRMQLELAGRADVARCVWSLATWLWPIPAFLMGMALRRADSDLLRQAMLDGAVRRITLRQLAGPAMASLACVAILAMQEFSVYEPTGISVVATEVRQVFQTGAFSSSTNPITAPMGGAYAGGDVSTDRSGASTVAVNPAPKIDTLTLAAGAAVATAAPLMVVVALLGLLAVWGVRRVQVTGEIETGPPPAGLSPGWVWSGLAVVVLILNLVLPVVALVLRHQLSWRPSVIWAASGDRVVNSVFYGVLAGLAGVVLGLVGSIRRPRGMLLLGVAGFLVGGQLLAVALIRMYNRDGLAWVYNSPLIMVIVYVARFGWLTLAAALATWSRPWRSMRDLAACDGASAVQSAGRVVWPVAWPLLAGAGVLVMILALSEVPATVLISPLSPQPIIPMLMTWVHTLDNDPMIEASLLLASVVMLLALVAAVLLRIGSRAVLSPSRRFGRATPLPIISLVCLLLTGCGDPTKPDEIWGDTGTAPGQVVYPRVISYSPADDTFFVIDRAARVQHLDRHGQYLGGWEMPECKQGKPVGATVGPDGNLYVADTHYHRIVVYSPAGQVVRQWGSDGTGDGQFIYPTDIAFEQTKEGLLHIFVSEYGDNDRVQVFNTAGQKLYQFGQFGDGPGQFSRPQAMVIRDGLVYLTDACNHRICVFTTDGKFVRNMGTCGSGLGQFRFPYGLDIDRDGRLVVCEFGNNRVQLIDRDTGKGLKTWGTAGREPGQLAYPWGVAVDKRGRVVTVDAGNNRFQVFNF